MNYVGKENVQESWPFTLLQEVKNLSCIVPMVSAAEVDDMNE